MSPSTSARTLDLVRAVWTQLRNLARRAARNHRAPADDLFQIALETAVRLAPDYDPARGSFGTFVHVPVLGALRDACARELRYRDLQRAIRDVASRPLSGQIRGDVPRTAAGRAEQEPTEPPRARGRLHDHTLAACAAEAHDKIAYGSATVEDRVIAARELVAVRRGVDHAVARLDGTDRALFVMCVKEGVAVSDAARRLGLRYMPAWRRVAGMRAAQPLLLPTYGLVATTSGE